MCLKYFFLYPKLGPCVHCSAFRAVQGFRERSASIDGEGLRHPDGTDLGRSALRERGGAREKRRAQGWPPKKSSGKKKVELGELKMGGG